MILEVRASDCYCDLALLASFKQCLFSNGVKWCRRRSVELQAVEEEDTAHIQFP